MSHTSNFLKLRIDMIHYTLAYVMFLLSFRHLSSCSLYIPSIFSNRIKHDLPIHLHPKEKKMPCRELQTPPPIQLVIDTTTNNTLPRSSRVNHKQSFTCFLSILARLHAGYFRIGLSFGSQALLWKMICQTCHTIILLMKL